MEPRRDVDIFWDFGSCPAPTDASGYAVVNQIRTLALRLGVVKSFKAYLSVSDHNSNGSDGRALTLRSELQSSGVSLTDAPGTKDVADKMLIVDILAHAFERGTNPDNNSNGNIIMLIAGDPSFSYLLSILRMRNHRVVVLGPGGGPEDYDNSSASLASQANLWLDWNAEITDSIIPRSTSIRVSPASRTTENLNSTSDLASKSESTVDSREQLVSAIAEAASDRMQANKDYSANDHGSGAAHIQQPTDQPTLQQPFKLNPQANARPASQSTATSTNTKANTVLSTHIEEEVLQKPVRSPTPPSKGNTGCAQNLEKPQPRATPNGTWAVDTLLDWGAERSSMRASSVKLEKEFSTWDDWPPSQPAVGVSSNRPSGNPPEYTPTSRWTQTKNAGAEVVVPPEFKNLVKVLRLSAASGATKPLYGVIAFDLTKEDPQAYAKAGVTRFSQFVTLAVEKGIVTTGGPRGVEWVSLHPNLR